MCRITHIGPPTKKRINQDEFSPRSIEYLLLRYLLHGKIYVFAAQPRLPDLRFVSPLAMRYGRKTGVDTDLPVRLLNLALVRSTVQQLAKNGLDYANLLGLFGARRYSLWVT
jgi:hypothetical protein